MSSAETPPDPDEPPPTEKEMNRTAWLAAAWIAILILTVVFLLPR